jgi:putative ABC transport system substrate-binding protein
MLLSMLFHDLQPKIQNLKLAGIFTVVVTFTLCGVIAQAQQPAKRAKIGRLSVVASRNRGQEEIVRLLREAGYTDGKNIDIEYRYAGQRLDRLPELAKELIALKVDLLVTPGTPGAIALKNATDRIPIIFLDVTDPVSAGLVDSLARPGRNLTGFTSIESILAGKRLELLKETVPNLLRVAVLWDGTKNPSSKQEWEESQKAARPLSLQPYSLEVISSGKYEAAFEEAVKARSAAVAILSSALTAANQELIARLAASKRLPSIFVRSESAGKGGPDVLRPESNRALHARRRAHRQNPQGQQTVGDSGGAADQIRLRHQSQNCQADRFKHSTQRLSQGGQSDPMTLQSKIGNRKSKIVQIPPNVLARADNVIR